MEAPASIRAGFFPPLLGSARPGLLSIHALRHVLANIDIATRVV